MSSPLPWGEGVPLPALSPAGAGRVRGILLSFADQPLRSASSIAVQSNSTPEPGFAGETGGETLPPALDRETSTVPPLSLGLVVPQWANCSGRGRQELRQRFNRTRWFAKGRNPSPVRRRLEKPSPQGRGLCFQLGQPRCPAKDMGNAQSVEAGNHCATWLAAGFGSGWPAAPRSGPDAGWVPA